MSRILLLEDDTMIASGILYALETEGYETNHATRIKDARSLMNSSLNPPFEMGDQAKPKRCLEY